MWALVCNATLEELRVLPRSEMALAGPLTFHELALIISAAASLVAVVLTLFLVWMHATNYTRPSEQKHVIRVLLMVPVQAAASILALRFHWHARYIRLASDCYEAVAISSFLALVLSLVGPDRHEQKAYFRSVRPVRPWIWPASWLRACFGRRAEPTNGLARFSVIWFGVYQYAFVRVAASVAAILTQQFGRYCESSNSPVFAHVWIVAIVCAAAVVAMYCLAQLYAQLRAPLAVNGLFLKFCAIDLIVFLTMWQSAAISIATSQIDTVRTNDVFSYPDLKVGIPSLLLCIEMGLFSVLNLWAFSYRPYREIRGARAIFYPSPDPASSVPKRENPSLPPAGGFLGLRALWEALNPWDVAKSVATGFVWLLTDSQRDGSGGRRGHAGRKGSNVSSDDLDLGDLTRKRPGNNSTDHLPIANQFRRSRFLRMNAGVYADATQTQTTPAGLHNIAENDPNAAAIGPHAVSAEVKIEPTAPGSAVGLALFPTPSGLLPQSPPPASPGIHRTASPHEHSGLIAHAASPGGRHRDASSPYREPPSPYRDEVFDDIANHPGVAIPYPGYHPESPRPPLQHQQWQQQSTTAGPSAQRPPPQPNTKPGHQRNFSRTLAGPSPPPRPQYRQTPPPMRHSPHLQQYEQRREGGAGGGEVEDGGMI